MGGCRCSYRNCKSATKLSGDLHFFHYPVKHRDRCNQWIKNARRPEFFHLPDDQLRNKVVCDLHFEPKHFTNILRKRLVHNAIPTIAVGCEDAILNDNSTEFKDVQVLPANDEGTIFTLDTDSMHQKADGDPISTYSFQDGALIPVYPDEQSDTEQVLYTIDEEDMKTEPYRQTNENTNNYLFIDSNKSDAESYEIVFNGNSSNSQTTLVEKKVLRQQSQSPIIVEYPRKNYMMNQSRNSSQDAMEVVYITEHDEREQSPVVIKTEQLDAVTIEPIRPRMLTNIQTKMINKNIKPVQFKEKVERKVREINKNISPQIIKKQFIKQIKLHSREIASIKRTLNANMRKTNKFNARTLKGKISSTLLGALTINLNKKKSNFTNDEYDFLTSLYKISPELYSVLIDKMHWNLPNPEIVQQLLNK